MAAVNVRLREAFTRHDAMSNAIEAQLSEMPADRRYADEIEAARAPLKIVEAEISRLKAEVGRAEREFQSHDCLDRAAKWLAEAPQLQRPFKHRSPPVVKAGADHRKLVEQARTRIDEVTGQIEAVELAPAPADDLRAQITYEVDRLAEAGCPAIDHRDPGSIGAALIRAARTDTFVLWLNRDALVAKLTAEIKDAANAMSVAAKEAAIADLIAERLTIERDEEATIAAAHVAGTIITRRCGADARALLELA
ncbi:hypothetical protein [Aminobacter sp. AP02]|uniref:hypothetical protein n=1 Tax=Aminobacter sp. AP02 TaxID=2135737 RepID=UPI0011B26332|nr:hypothetical protein [Aminobacter sp. AP02]